VDVRLGNSNGAGQNTEGGERLREG
jgi:hypothetical protein